MQETVWEQGWQLWDLMAHLHQIGSLQPGYLFRGQSNAGWDLVPSLYRIENACYPGIESKAERYHLVENHMLEAFFRRAALHLPRFERGPLMDRFVAQHYGVPTQLLDWTLDPLIALYFAVQGKRDDDDCALFYLHPMSTINARVYPLKLPWQGWISKVVPPTIDDRVRAQKSIFTLQSFGSPDAFIPINKRDFKKLEAGDSPMECDRANAIGKIRIPGDRRGTILQQLMQMGIDSSLVYPGLQGIGKRIADIAQTYKFHCEYD